MSAVCFKDILHSKNGYDIHMIVTKPLDSEKHPCVILLHGTCSDMNEVGNAYVYLANQLANAGYAAIRFDFIGSGHSEVDYIHYSYRSAISDTQEVIAYAKNLGYDQLTLLGWSQGAAIALLSANDDISSVVTLAAAADMRILIEKDDYETAKINGYVWYNPGFREPVKLSLEWFEDVLHTDVLEIYSHKHLPTLSIHGMKDEIVDPAYSKMCADAGEHPYSKVIYMDDCNHIFNVLTDGYDYFDVVGHEIIQWLNLLFKKDILLS